MKWTNIPIPEGHLITLILGIILQIIFPLPLINIKWISYGVGVALLIAGILLIAWSVFAVREINVESPDRVIMKGPYAFSRNPMYVAWSFIFLSAFFLVNSLWLLTLFLPVLIYTHFFVILPEEERLADQFGEEYLRYKSRVRRYI